MVPGFLLGPQIAIAIGRAVGLWGRAARKWRGHGRGGGIGMAGGEGMPHGRQSIILDWKNIDLRCGLPLFLETRLFFAGNSLGVKEDVPLRDFNARGGGATRFAFAVFPTVKQKLHTIGCR